MTFIKFLFGFFVGSEATLAQKVALAWLLAVCSVAIYTGMMALWEVTGITGFTIIVGVGITVWALVNLEEFISK